MSKHDEMCKDTHRVLVIGGYGNFGSYIIRRLAGDTGIQLIIAGRSGEKAAQLARSIDAVNPPESARIDINDDLQAGLADLAPDIVIHTSGPFQGQGYDVARACIRAGCHYIDLADGRDFVCNIDTLDADAKAADVLVCTGASSLPALSTAIIAEHLHRFGSLESLDYAIATAQKTNRGLATTRAVLSYAGRSFKSLRNGQTADVFGWQSTRRPGFWRLGPRRISNCDVPDLELFPKRYPGLKHISFQAGLEIQFIHLSVVALGWLTRLRLLPGLERFAAPLLNLSRLVDWMGTEKSGFFMKLAGTGVDGQKLTIRYDIHATRGDGLNIPIIPAILMARKLAAGQVVEKGAMPCMGFITLEEYQREMAKLHIEWQTTFDPASAGKDTPYANHPAGG